MMKRSDWICASVACLAALATGGAFFAHWAAPHSDAVALVSPAPPQDAPMPEEPSGTVALAAYEQLSLGMGYEDAVAILGGRESDAYTAMDPAAPSGHAVVWRVWRVAEGGEIRLGFVEQRLVKKLQTGVQ